MGCQCDDAFTGDHCEFLRDMPVSSLATSSGRSAGAVAGITLSVLAILILGTMLAIRRKRQQLRAQIEQRWKYGEMKFRRFYLEMLARDSMHGGDNDDDELDDQDKGTVVGMDEEEDRAEEPTEEEVGDLQLMLEAAGSGEPYEAGTNSEFV